MKLFIAFFLFCFVASVQVSSVLVGFMDGLVHEEVLHNQKGCDPFHRSRWTLLVPLAYPSCKAGEWLEL